MEQLARKGRMVGTVMAGIGTAGLYATKRLVDGARDVSRAYGDVSTMMDGTANAVDVYRDQVRQLSREYGTQGGELDNINALYDILSAGVTDTEESMELLEIAMIGASAGATETAVAVDGLTSVLNAYNLASTEAEQIQDVLFETVRRGKIRYEELAGSIGDVLPIASQLDVQLEEVTSAIATMTRQGISGAKATTYLRQTMQQFLRPSEDLAQTIQELGYESGEAMLKQEGLAGSLALLEQETGGSSEAMSELFPNVRALQGALALTGDSAQGFQEDLQAMQESSGSTADAFEKQTNTMAYQLEKVDGRLEAVKLELGEGTSPAMLHLKEITADVGEGIVELDNKTGGMISTLYVYGSALMSSVGSMIATTSQIYLMIWARNQNTVAMQGENASRLASIKTLIAEKVAIAGTTTVKYASALATKVVTVAQWLWNASLYACPLVWIIGLIIGVIAVIYILINHTDKVREAFDWLWERMQSVWDGIKRFASWIRELFIKTLQNVIQMFKNIGKYAMKGIEAVVNFFKELPGRIWEEVQKLIGKAVEWGLDFAREFISGVTDGIKNLGGRMKDGLRDAIGFDVRANDRMAERWGKDLAEYQVQGYADEMGRLPTLAGTEPASRDRKAGVGAEKRINIELNVQGVLGLDNAKDRREFISLIERELSNAGGI